MDKRECLKNAQRALSLAHPEIESASELLERGCGFIASDSFEYLDIDLLQLMAVVYYRKGDATKAAETEKKLAKTKSTIQSRDFLAIAEHYKSTGADYVWALRIASAADPSNPYSTLAKAELSALAVEVIEELLAPEQSKDPEYDKQVLIEKPSHEFSVADCYMLMNWLEQELRSLIVDELSRLTPQWWKQRIPPDTRTGLTQSIPNMRRTSPVLRSPRLVEALSSRQVPPRQVRLSRFDHGFHGLARTRVPETLESVKFVESVAASIHLA